MENSQKQKPMNWVQYGKERSTGYRLLRFEITAFFAFSEVSYLVDERNIIKNKIKIRKDVRLR
jgi:CRISPR/Cas system CSM-associated protein Csm3 (group 7 of RAMP superfamily)